MRKRKRHTLRPGFDSPSATRAKWLPLEEAALALSFAGREGGKARERERVDKEERRPAAGSSSSSLPTPPLSLQPPQTLSAKKKAAAAAAKEKNARLFVPPDLSPARRFSAPLASQEPDLVFASVSVSRGAEKRV
jgi:hypothetical protein